MLGRISRRAFRAISAASVAASLVDPALACTRTLFVGQDGTVITGRNMDWKEDMATNLWVLPAGMQRDGAAGPNSLKWTSKYGSVVASGYEAGTADGMNEKGLVVNLLYLAEAEYSKPDKTKPDLSIAAWAQIVLDSYANVAEAVTGLEANSFDILAPTLPNGSPASLHLSISDSGGDSAIFEFLDGKLTIHHGRDYTVMTNSPVYSQQLAIDAYWKSIGGLTFLPGTNRAADRFARASFLIESVPKAIAPQYIKGVPGQSFANQAAAEVMSVQRAVSVPLGITTPNEPNISSTIWRTVSDQKNRLYYFDSATRPNTFWVALDRLDLKPGAKVRKLVLADGQVYSGEVSDKFVDSEPFKFLPAPLPAE